MRANDLVELSAVLAVNGRAFIRGQGRLADGRIHEYWLASKSRHDRWTRALTDYRERASRGTRVSLSWSRVSAVIEEVFTGEILTRVWTAIACEHDRRHGSTYVSPVVRSVLLAHLEARNRALGVLFDADDYELDEVLSMNRLRCRSERWTDVLLAQLVPDCDIADYAFDIKRVYDFAEDFSDGPGGPDADQAWRILEASLKSSFRTEISNRAANADLNAQIASAIISCFQPGLRDSAGTLGSLWMERLSHTTLDTQAMIDELLSVD